MSRLAGGALQSDLKSGSCFPLTLGVRFVIVVEALLVRVPAQGSPQLHREVS